MKIRRAAAETKMTIGQIKNTLASLNTLPQLKEFIKDFALDEDEDDELASLLLGALASRKS
jgi:hypothetical protein